MKINILKAGYCTCPEHLAIQGGHWRGIRFPAMFALLEHPRFGPMLFDTGYSYRFFAETRNFPNRFYRTMTPVTLHEEDLAVNQLAKRNIKTSDISHIFISHFHADHVASLVDFNRARFVYLSHAYEFLRQKRGMDALSAAFMPGLIPGDFDGRSTPINMNNSIHLSSEYSPFVQGCDLLGDESVVAVELPGHAVGQMGLFVRDSEDKLFFFIADAAWLKRSVVENRPPHRIANLLFPDSEKYRETLANLNTYYLTHPRTLIIPSHCEETISMLSGAIASASHLAE
jgi:glyoxylase-like metal-dependent hydrolase (beta-lactamase superfamily II)